MWYRISDIKPRFYKATRITFQLWAIILIKTLIQQILIFVHTD